MDKKEVLKRLFYLQESKNKKIIAGIVLVTLSQVTFPPNLALSITPKVLKLSDV